jgi:hypothetical protein
MRLSRGGWGVVADALPPTPTVAAPDASGRLEPPGRAHRGCPWMPGVGFAAPGTTNGAAVPRGPNG